MQSLRQFKYALVFSCATQRYPVALKSKDDCGRASRVQRH